MHGDSLSQSPLAVSKSQLLGYSSSVPGQRRVRNWTVKNYSLCLRLISSLDIKVYLLLQMMLATDFICARTRGNNDRLLKAQNAGVSFWSLGLNCCIMAPILRQITFLIPCSRPSMSLFGTVCGRLVDRKMDTLPAAVAHKKRLSEVTMAHASGHLSRD